MYLPCAIKEDTPPLSPLNCRLCKVLLTDELMADFFENPFCLNCAEKVVKIISEKFNYNPFSEYAETEGNCVMCKVWVKVGSKGVLVKAFLSEGKAYVRCRNENKPQTTCTSCPPPALEHLINTYCHELSNIV